MADSLWVIGASMTKFMRYKDKDLIDLGSEAALAALADAGLTIFDADILAAGCLYETGGMGQRLQKQIGQTGIPVYNVSNACATGATAFRVAAMAIKAGEADIGLAVGVSLAISTQICPPRRRGRAAKWLTRSGSSARR